MEKVSLAEIASCKLDVCTWTVR